MSEPLGPRPERPTIGLDFDDDIRDYVQWLERALDRACVLLGQADTGHECACRECKKFYNRLRTFVTLSTERGQPPIVDASSLQTPGSQP